MTFTEELRQKIDAGLDITREEALALVNVPLEELTAAANELRAQMCGRLQILCTKCVLSYRLRRDVSAVTDRGTFGRREAQQGAGGTPLLDCHVGKTSERQGD